MPTTYNFMLTVSMGKRLIARGLAANKNVREAMLNRRLLIVAGTTNAYVSQEILKAVGDDTPFDAQTFRRGVTVAPGAKLAPGGASFDLLIDHGKARFDRDVFEIAPELGEGDMILKGANALYLSPDGNREAGVLIGHPQGGTLMPITAAAVGRRVQLLVPIGVEKRVQRPIGELTRLANAAPGAGPRLAFIPGVPYTEIDALNDLIGISSAELLASGGVMGAEGCAYFTVHNSVEAIERLKSLLEELRVG